MIWVEGNSKYNGWLVLLGCKRDILRLMSLLIIYGHQLWESGEISFLKITSCDNHADLFTKSLPLVIFDKCVKDIGMNRLKDLHGSAGEPL
jgi:hypothetical protein